MLPDNSAFTGSKYSFQRRISAVETRYSARACLPTASLGDFVFAVVDTGR
jgi:hypothetical protein